MLGLLQVSSTICILARRSEYPPHPWHYHPPGGVVAGQGNGHGWHRVLYYGDQLDVTQVEVTLLTEPVENHSVLFYCVAVVVRTHLQMVLRIQTFDRLNKQWILINLELRSAENILF